MSAPSNEGELGPWDERRLPREMYVKLFVVHFTVIGAYAHLLHLRREPRKFFSFVLMLACPIGGVALLVSPLIALLIQTIICHGDRAILNQSIGILIGQVPRDEDADTHEAGVNWPPEFSSKLVRRVVLQLALLAQCITSIWLFARRAQHGSDALYDYRILQLAILGLSTSAISLLHMILRPQYPARRFRHDYPARCRWLVFLRPMLTSEPGESPEMQGISLTSDSSGPSETQRMLQIPLVVIDWVYACIALSVAQALGLEFDRSLPVYSIFVRMSDFESHILYFLPFLVLLAVHFREVLLHQPRTSSQWVSFALFAFCGAFFVFVVAIPLSVYLNSLALEFILKPVQSGLQIRTLLSKPYNYQSYQTAYNNYGANATRPGIIENITVFGGYESVVFGGSWDISPDWNRIWTYGHVPASFPCPQAWKDPAADYVWWLA